MTENAGHAICADSSVMAVASRLRALLAGLPQAHIQLFLTILDKDINMPNIQPLNINDADSKTAQTLNAVKAGLGMIPNLFFTLARSPVVLDAYLQFSGMLDNGRLTARQREIVALAVAQDNSCEYCLSAHTLLGKGAGLSENDIRLARHGKAEHPADNAVSILAQKLVQLRGQLAPTDVQDVRNAGLDDGLIIEVIANVTVNIFTNYTNLVAGTDIDFPRVGLEL